MAWERELMALHLDALFSRDGAGRLLRVRDHDAAPAPRFFLGRTPSGAVWACRHDVSADVVRDLDATATGMAAAFARLEAVLARDAPITGREAGPVFRVPERLAVRDAIEVRAMILRRDQVALLSPLLPAWAPDTVWSQPLVALVSDGRAVAVCASVRRTGRVHEAGVEVAQAWRGRGHAGQVVAAWAAAVRAAGAQPLYSTEWRNTGSLAVARKLRFEMYGDELTMV